MMYVINLKFDKELSNFQWAEMPWRPCDVRVMCIYGMRVISMAIFGHCYLHWYRFRKSYCMTHANCSCNHNDISCLWYTNQCWFLLWQCISSSSLFFFKIQLVCKTMRASYTIIQSSGASSVIYLTLTWIISLLTDITVLGHQQAWWCIQS